MRYILLVLSLFVGLAFAEDQAEKDFNEAVAKAKVDMEFKLVLARDKYTLDLEKMKTAAMKAGDLDAAIALKARIDALKPAPSAVVEQTTPKPAPKVPPIVDRFVGTYDMNRNGNPMVYVITYENGGFVLREPSGGMTSTECAFVGANPVFAWPDGFDDAVAVEFDNGKYTITQLKGQGKNLKTLKVIGGTYWFKLPAAKR